MTKHAVNLLLASLSESDMQALSPHLQPTTLKQHQLLFDAGETVSRAYFPIDAVVSLVVMLATGETIEAAMVGRDGVVGAAAALDGKVSLSRGAVQIGGTSLSCSLDVLKDIALRSPAVLSLLVRNEQTVYAQAQQSAACNVTHSVEARLSRWLLRAHDLSGSKSLPFTQQFLGRMIGVSRPSVSLVSQLMHEAGAIRYSRGRIQILDLEGLEGMACECYGTIKAYYGTMLGRE